MRETRRTSPHRDVFDGGLVCHADTCPPSGAPQRERVTRRYWICVVAQIMRRRCSRSDCASLMSRYIANGCARAVLI